MLLGGHAGAQTPTLEKLTLGTTGLSTYYSLPVVIADRRGYFKEEGLAVELVDFQGGSRVLQALVGGSIDVAAGGYDHVVTMQAKGIELKALVETMRYPAIAVGVTKANMAGYKSAADLRGKTIGVSSPGSSTQGVLNAFLEKNGVKPSEVSVVGLGAPATARAAVENGKVDAIAYVDPLIAMLEAEGQLRVIVDTRTRAGAEAVYGGESLAGVVYASKTLIDKRGAAIQSLVHAMRKSLTWLAQATPQQVADAVPAEYLAGNRDFYIQTFARFREALAPPQLIGTPAARIGLIAAAALNPAIKAESIDIAATIDNRFMQAALKSAAK